MNFISLLNEVGPVTMAITIASGPSGPHWFEASTVNPFVPWFIKNYSLQNKSVIKQVISIMEEVISGEHIVVLGNDLFLINNLSSRKNRLIDVILPSHIEPKIVSRIDKNRPNNRVRIYQMPNFPDMIQPTKIAVIIVGVQVGASYAAIPHGISEILAILRLNFLGEIILLDLIGHPVPAATKGWVNISVKETFTYLVTPDGAFDLEIQKRSVFV